MINLSKAKAYLAVALLFILCVSGVSAQSKDWRPVSQADLQTTPVVEPNADAEALFWEVRVDDSSSDELSMRHYVRIKIFTDRGREDFASHDVLFTKGTKIKDFEARVTKPDGSVSLVDKDEIKERDVVKASGFRVRAKSIAFPGLEAGSIIEYKYKEVIEDVAANMRLILQREIPMREVTYYVRPFSGNRAMAYQGFNIGKTAFVKDKNGFYKVGMQNVPAFREESSMLPEDEVKSWIYIYYTADTTRNAEAYWMSVSSNAASRMKDILKANDQVKNETARIIAGATSDDEKLRRIYEYTKREIKNTTYAESSTEEEKKQAAKNKSAGDTIKYKVGTASDIDQLFGAMARSAGFDARVAYSGNRNELFFDRSIPNVSLMLNSSSIAVKVGESWRFFSPASYFIPYGMLSWVEEHQTALIPDSKELIWKRIPLSKSELSMEKRSGVFTLDENGTLTGDVKIEFTGHQAYTHKILNRGDSVSVMEERLRSRIRSSIASNAEIENIVIENVNDPEKPFVYKCKVNVPGYALKTGRRLLFQPNIFEKSSQPRFTANTRKYDIYISYPYSEKDDIRINFPAGFELEKAEMPGPIRDQQGIGAHFINAKISDDGRIFTYSREFSFGNEGIIRFPADGYAGVKNLFEAFHKADMHSLSLRAKEAATPGN